MNFTENQIERYSRHIILQEVGPEGQKKINNAKVLVAGVGGLGSPVALYLAAAGVGTIGLADNDVVDMTNLQRQVIHFTSDLDKHKVESAADKISALNPDVDIRMHKGFLNPENIAGIITGYDFIIDGTDNFPSKFLINDACVINGKAFSHGGILRFEGQTMTYTPGNTCYRCVFGYAPPKNAVPSCSQAGVLGSIAGILGTIQATEAIKYIIGKGRLLTNRMLTFNAFDMNFGEIILSANSDCPVCGSNPVITKLEMDEQPVCDLKQ